MAAKVTKRRKSSPSAPKRKKRSPSSSKNSNTKKVSRSKGRNLPQDLVKNRHSGPTPDKASQERPEVHPNISKNWFKKGQSGNPAGKPKGTISMTHHLHDLLKQEVEVKRKRKKVKVTVAEQLVEMAIKAARKGKFNFFKEIYDRIDGKVPDHVIQETTKLMIKQEAESIAAEIMELVSVTLAQHLDDDTKVAAILTQLAVELEKRYVSAPSNDALEEGAGDA